MKKWFRFKSIPVLALIAVVALTAAVLSACKKNEPTNAGAFTESVSSAADFEKMRERLGSFYDQGVFELTENIVLDGNWTPVGTSVTDSFRGTLDGKGHTVSYNIVIPAPEKTDLSAVGQSAVYGLFGYLAGATVKNLNIEVHIEVPVETNIAYVGGLAGFVYGDTVIENVSVSGYVKTSLGNILNEETFDLFGSGLSASVGGLFGYAIGDVTLRNVVSSADVNVGAYSSFGEVATLGTVQAGGIGGTLRTENISGLTAEKLESVSHVSAENVSCSGSVEAWGAILNAGGLFGLTHRTLAEDVRFTGDVKAYFVTRMNLGGIVGTLDTGDFSSVVLGSETAGSSVTAAKAFAYGEATASIGGIAGYVSNKSVLHNALAYTDMRVSITQPKDIRHYLGGIAGQVYFSDISDAAVSGTYVNDAFTEDFSHSQAAGYLADYYAYTGGIVGRLYGYSSLTAATSIISGVYQAIVGEALGGFEVATPDGGKSITEWLEANGYPLDTSYRLISDEGDEEDTYLITHVYTLSDVLYLYAEVDSRTDSDRSAVSNGKGVLSDETTLSERLNAVAAAINA